MEKNLLLIRSKQIHIYFALCFYIRKGLRTGMSTSFYMQ